MPQTIADILRVLSASDRSTLMAAFEERIPHHVEYVSGRFIGVNTDNDPHLICEQRSGTFREGSVVHHSVRAVLS